MMEESLLPISLICHTAFCPRRTWLEVNGEETDTYQMQVGYKAHSRVDNPVNSRRKRNCSVPVRSDSWGIVGKIDSVEIDAHGGLHIIEYKSTPVRRKAVVTPAQRLQLVLQRECLQSEGRPVKSTSIYFTEHRQLVDVELSSDDVAEAHSLVELTKSIVNSSESPPTLVNDERCSKCSHSSVCLPDEHQLTSVKRRVVATDPDGQVLHLTVQGSRASIRSGRIIVSKAGEELGTIPLEKVCGVVVHGNIDLSSALNRAFMWNSVPIVWCSSTGRVYGFSRSTDSPNGLARARQHVLSQTGSLPIASAMIHAKVWNQATLLRRNAPDSQNHGQMRQLAAAALEATDLPSLFGIEGDAASLYFASFPNMFSQERLADLGWEWIGRRGRSADDPINVLLNYCYGLLKSEATRAILACGLDPHAGFLHSSNRNKPALSLDLMEEFRAPVADSTVIATVNRREIKDSDFSKIGNAYRLRDTGRKKIIQAFERRIQTSFKHPLFDYTITWRRALEVQARLVLSVIDGSLPQYEGIRIR